MTGSHVSKTLSYSLMVQLVENKKKALVALSTMKAEYAALAELSREIVYVKRLLTYMGFEKFIKNPINVFCENQSAIELFKNAVCFTNGASTLTLISILLENL